MPAESTEVVITEKEKAEFEAATEPTDSPVEKPVEKPAEKPHDGVPHTELAEDPRLQ